MSSLVHRLDRRAFLSIGGLGAAASLLRANDAPARNARVKSIIFLHQFGGPSHVDTFDMKPDMPDQIRGIYRPMSSTLIGTPICDRLPRMAKVMDKVCLIRSMRHEMKNHNSAGYYSLTGQAPPTDDQRLRDSRELYPAYGSVIDRFSSAPEGVASFVSYPHTLSDGSITPGQHASFLGPAHDPFFISQDPNSPDFRLPELSLPANLNVGRLNDRREVQRLIDATAAVAESSTRARGIETYYQRALSLLASPRFRQAFDLSREPAAARDRYGRTTYGQGCLLARRLVETGVKCVTVYFAATIGGRRNEGGWDTHGFDNNPMYPIMNDYLLPITDQTLPTLLEDLDHRGLLDTTLVVWAGEFGRSPRINNIAGRDHWPQCYTVLLAGAGVKRGFVFGSSDTRGAYPSTNPVRPEDLSATMFHLMGIDPHTLVRDPLDRPVPLSTGSVIQGILA
jgi:hypothetical protein